MGIRIFFGSMSGCQHSSFGACRRSCNRFYASGQKKKSEDCYMQGIDCIVSDLKEGKSWWNVKTHLLNAARPRMRCNGQYYKKFISNYLAPTCLFFLVKSGNITEEEENSMFVQLCVLYKQEIILPDKFHALTKCLTAERLFLNPCARI